MNDARRLSATLAFECGWSRPMLGLGCRGRAPYSGFARWATPSRLRRGRWVLTFASAETTLSARHDGALHCRLEG